MKKGIHICFLTFSLFFSSILIHAQAPCAFDQVHHEWLATDSSYSYQQAQNEKRISKLLEKDAFAQKSTLVYTIPVVVHIIYSDPAAEHNISDEQIMSAIRRLNEIFAGETGTNQNSYIDFCLASQDPFCNPTTGINRINGSVVPDYTTEGIDIETVDTDGKGARRLDVLNLSRWNPAEYLNIWVVTEISDNNGEAGVQAYATLPGTSYNYDGVVILFNAFGFDYDNCNCFSLKEYTDENKILAHEVGHYLGLFHTFEGDGGGSVCPGNTTTTGDRVTDTPAHKRSFFCLTGQNSCYTSPDPFADIEKIIHNFMGYAPESCQWEFSPGQIERMRAQLLANRPGLVRPQSCGFINVNLPPFPCQPQTQAGLSAEYGMGITAVRIGDWISTSGTSFQDGGYLERPCREVALQPNTTYDIEVTTFGFNYEDVRVYIDYNNDLDLASEELIFSSNNHFSHKGTFTTPEVVPKNQPLRMRVLSDHFQFNIDDACYVPQYGQVEDYTAQFPFIQTEWYERGQSVRLDGINDYLISDVAPEIAQDSYTIEFWCKPEGDPKECQVIFDKSMNNFSSLHFMAIWHGRMFIYQGKDLLYLPTWAKIEYDTWQHIAYSWDGQVQKLYVNGLLTGTDTVNQIIPNQAPFRFASFFGSYLFFKGQLDEIRIWPEVRSDQKIRENMYLTYKTLSSASVTFNFNQPDTTGSVSDISGTHLITSAGGPDFVSSTAPLGYAGISETRDSLDEYGNMAFPNADVTLSFLPPGNVSSITAILPSFEPNTLEGTNWSDPSLSRSWFLITSDPDPLEGDLTFFFPGYDFSNVLPEDFQLYHRKTGSDSPWILVAMTASSLQQESVRFNQIKITGQFLVLKK